MMNESHANQQLFSLPNSAHFSQWKQGNSMANDKFHNTAKNSAVCEKRLDDGSGTLNTVS